MVSVQPVFLDSHAAVLKHSNTFERGLSVGLEIVSPTGLGSSLQTLKMIAPACFQWFYQLVVFKVE